MPQQKQGTSSRLVARLREISRGTSTPFGFVGRAQARGLPAMLLIASLARNDATLTKAAVDAGADAVLAHLHIGEAPASSKSDGELAPPAEQAAAVTAAAAADASAPASPVSQLAPPADTSLGSPSPLVAPPPSPLSTEEAQDGEEAGPAGETADTYFGGLEEERERLVQMVGAADGRPVGVVVGANGELTVSELEELARIGIDFVAVYPHRAPAALLTIEALGHVARLDPGYPASPTRGLADLEIDAFAVSAGRPRDSLPGFTVHDMASFRQFLDTLQRPVIVASSWEIRPDDLKFFREQGVEALILTPHVLGDTAESVRDRVSEIQKAITALGPPLGRGRSQEGRRVVLPQVLPVGGPAEDGDDDDDD